MNIKNIIIASYITLQLSTWIYADQAAWDAAFKKFSGKTNLKEAAEYIETSGGSLNLNKTKALAAELGKTPEALQVGLYMTDGNPNTLAAQFKGAAQKNDLINAINIAKNNADSSTNSAHSEPQPQQQQQNGSNQVNSTKTAAATLKTQIEASISLYNEAAKIAGSDITPTRLTLN